MNFIYSAKGEFSFILVIINFLRFTHEGIELNYFEFDKVLSNYLLD